MHINVYQFYYNSFKVHTLDYTGDNHLTLTLEFLNKLFIFKTKLFLLELQSW